MDSIAAGELPQVDGISWKYENSIEFPKTDHELSGHGSHRPGPKREDETPCYLPISQVASCNESTWSPSLSSPGSSEIVGLQSECDLLIP